MTSSTLGTALIAGASWAIGAVYAGRLPRVGCDLMRVARSEAPPKELAESLHSETGRRVTPVVADLAVCADLGKVEAILQGDAAITVLVNNARTGSVRALLDEDVKKMSRMIAIVVDAALAGLDQGELVTIRSLHGGDEWTRFEDARQAISSQFGNSMPAPRYGIPASK